ncbi:hypothetical protein THICB3600006 [Thiomonas sp. CB3]|nr:hypothetical protein THICB3600006 [Thiomonas sp. CB3]
MERDHSDFSSVSIGLQGRQTTVDR